MEHVGTGGSMKTAQVQLVEIAPIHGEVMFMHFVVDDGRSVQQEPTDANIGREIARAHGNVLAWRRISRDEYATARAARSKREDDARDESQVS